MPHVQQGRQLAPAALGRLGGMPWPSRRQRYTPLVAALGQCTIAMLAAARSVVSRSDIFKPLMLAKYEKFLVKEVVSGCGL